MTYSSPDPAIGWSCGTTMSSGRTSCRSGTIRAAIACSSWTLTRRWRSPERWMSASASMVQSATRRDHSSTRLGDRVLRRGEDGGHLGGRRSHRVGDQGLQRVDSRYRAGIARCRGVPDGGSHRCRGLVRGDHAEGGVAWVRELRREIGGRHDLATAIGQRAEQQDSRVIHVAAGGKDLVAAEAGHRPVGGPVDDRVQRAEIVGLGPGGVRLVRESIGEQRLSPRLRGDELEPLDHLPFRQVGLWQYLQPLPQVRRRDELDDLLRAVVPPADPASRDRRCRGLVSLIKGVFQEGHLRGIEGRLGGRVIGRPRGDTGGGGGTGHDAREHASDGVLGLDGLRLLHHLIQARLPGQHLADLVLFSADVVLAHQRRGVAERGVRLVLLLDEAAKHPQVAGERLGLGVEQQRRDLRRVPLAVPVNAAVALLDPDQGPRDVVVDELVALLVEVHALAGQVAGDQHADGR